MGLSPLLAGVSQCLGGMDDQADPVVSNFLERQQVQGVKGCRKESNFPRLRRGQVPGQEM